MRLPGLLAASPASRNRRNHLLGINDRRPVISQPLATLNAEYHIKSTGLATAESGQSRNHLITV